MVEFSVKYDMETKELFIDGKRIGKLNEKAAGKKVGDTLTGMVREIEVREIINKAFE